MDVKKKLGVAVLLLVGVIAAATQLGTLQQFLTVVADASIPLLVVALVFRSLYYAANAATYNTALHIVEEDLGFATLLKLAVLSSLVRITVPSAGFSGNVFLVKRFTDRGLSPGTATTAVILNGFCFYIAFFSMLFFGIAYLSVLEAANLSLIQFGSAAVFGVLAFAALYYLVFVTQTQDRVQRHAETLRTWFKKVKYIPPADVTVFANDLYEGRKLAEENGSQIITLTFLKFVKEFMNAVTVFVIALAYNAPATFLASLVAYAVASTLAKLLLVPGGIGTYETLMILVFTAFLVPFEYALAITLTFRVLTFWLPMLFGPLLLKELM